MGGKVSTLFESRTDHPRIHLLLRLPPLSVSDVPEVRCAVVGNVDSGKSTTLGVLTRGMFLHRSIFRLLILIKVHSTMEEAGLVLHYSDINTRSRAGGLPALEWRFDSVFHCNTSVSFIWPDQILGFNPEGSPILPASTHVGESGVVRQEKLGWEEICKESAKIISFIGLYQCLLVNSP